METSLTIGVPTCNRYKKILACLEAIKTNLSLPARIMVLDSMPDDKTRDIYRVFNVEPIFMKEPVSPSTARKIIAENTNSDLLLFLDDDIIIREGAVERLVDYLDNGVGIQAVGGCWSENGHYREVGQNFNFGRIDGCEVVWKNFITRDQCRTLGLTSIKVDAVLATMLVRKEIFEVVAFDPVFDFYYELFDFFLQCRRKNLVIHSLPDVVFDHFPGGYEKRTKRDSPIEFDRARFERKWNLKPIGKLGMPPSRKSPFSKWGRKLFSGIGIRDRP